MPLMQWRRFRISQCGDRYVSDTVIHKGLISQTKFFALLFKWIVSQMVLVTTAATAAEGTMSASKTAMKTTVVSPCRLFLAESSLQNSGWGVFAGVDFQPGESLVRNESELVTTKNEKW
jgi:hypothetical protein